MANPNWFAMHAVCFLDAICILFTNELQNELLQFGDENTFANRNFF